MQAFWSGFVVNGKPFKKMMLFKDTVGCNVKCRHLYLCYSGKYIGAYNPYTNEVVGYETLNNFTPFVKDIIEKYPDYSPHNVVNEGISELIRRKILIDIAKRELIESFGKSK